LHTFCGSHSVHDEFVLLSSTASDTRDALSVRPIVGPPCIPAAIQSLNGTVFSPSQGARRGSVPSVVIVVTDADSPFNYSPWTNAGVSARLAGLDVYAVAIGNAPYSDVMASIAGDGSDHVLRVNGPDDVTSVADRLLTTLCQL